MNTYQEVHDIYKKAIAAEHDKAVQMWPDIVKKIKKAAQSGEPYYVLESTYVGIHTWRKLIEIAKDNGFECKQPGVGATMHIIWE